MATTAPSSAADSSGEFHDQEARLLAELLRTSRLALLYGEAGADRTALLRHGLMPLLHRRTGDHPAPLAARESGVVVPFPDRRRRSSAGAAKRRREFVVYFDRWADAPLSELHAAICQAAATTRAEPAGRLAETLDALSTRFDAGFIIVLDRFEEVLRAGREREDIAQFASELVDAVNQPQLAANFLLSLTEEARPRLANLRSRIPGFDDFSLKLAGPRDVKPATPRVQPLHQPDPMVIEGPPVLTETSRALPVDVAATPGATAVPARRSTRRPKVKQPPPPRVQIKTEDVYALINATLARTGSEAESQPFGADEVVDTTPADIDRFGAWEAQAPHLQLPLPRGGSLRAAAQWVGRLLRRKPHPDPDA